MFKLEIIEILNKYSKTEDEYEKNKIKNTISNLILENNNEFNNFIATTNLEPEIKRLLKECSLKVNQKNNDTENEKSSDFEIIKNYFYKWQKNYNNNQFKPNKECEIIIFEIINFYALNRFEVLKEILKIEDSQDFENFKNMLNNYLRKFFSDKLNKYMESENYLKLGFFKKRKKEKEILEILNLIGEYKFETNKINKIFE